MNKFIILSVIIKLFLYSNVFCMNWLFVNSVSNYGSGKKTFVREKVNSINANGSIKLEETHVLKSVNINGRLEATNSKIASAHVNGYSFFGNCIRPCCINS